MKSDGRWIVRTMSGSAAVKEYRCPGCSQVIRVGTPHVVVWPADPGWGSSTGSEQRRHWHNSCWERRR
jgi:hypothetical protein